MANHRIGEVASDGLVFVNFGFSGGDSRRPKQPTCDGRVDSGIDRDNEISEETRFADSSGNNGKHENFDNCKIAKKSGLVDVAAKSGESEVDVKTGTSFVFGKLSEDLTKLEGPQDGTKGSRVGYGAGKIEDVVQNKVSENEVGGYVGLGAVRAETDFLGDKADVIEASEISGGKDRVAEFDEVFGTASEQALAVGDTNGGFSGHVDEEAKYAMGSWVGRSKVYGDDGENCWGGGRENAKGSAKFEALSIVWI